MKSKNENPFDLISDTWPSLRFSDILFCTGSVTHFYQIIFISLQYCKLCLWFITFLIGPQAIPEIILLININEDDSLIITEQNINILNLGNIEGKIQLCRVIEGGTVLGREQMAEFPLLTQYKKRYCQKLVNQEID